MSAQFEDLNIAYRNTLQSRHMQKWQMNMSSINKPSLQLLQIGCAGNMDVTCLNMYRSTKLLPQLTRRNHHKMYY